ncbi:hypothetical protein TorRG33x02_067540, partial [Trema orientale]
MMMMMMMIMIMIMIMMTILMTMPTLIVPATFRPGSYEWGRYWVTQSFIFNPLLLKLSPFFYFLFFFFFFFFFIVVFVFLTIVTVEKWSRRGRVERGQTYKAARFGSEKPSHLRLSDSKPS